MATASRPGTTGANRATRRAKPAAEPKTATKAAPKKATVVTEDLVDEAPKSSAHMTLSEIEAEVAELPELEPFTFDTVGNDDPEDFVTIKSPSTVPYAISSSNSLDAVFSYAMSDEDWEKFIDADLTTAQAGIVFLKWRKHYGMGSQGE